MAERGDGGFEVVPTRIGGSGGPARSGRRRWAPIIVVIAIALLVPTVAWIGPRIEWRPEVDLSFLQPTPSITPRPTPRPTQRLATPAPAITIGVGPHPTEPFPVDVGGLRMADPATGELGPTFGMRGDNDAIFRSADGSGWWCVCFTRSSDGNSDTAMVEMRRVDAAGQVTQRREVGEYRSAAPPPTQDFYVRFDLEVAPDGQMAYLASATRSGDQWTVVLEAIDLVSFEVVSRTDLGIMAIPPAPTPTPSPDQGMIENYLGGPFMRLSPDGLRMVVWAWIDTSSSTGPMEPAESQGWLLDLGGGAGGRAVGPVSPVDPSLLERLRTCYWVTWTAADELAAICWPSTDGAQRISYSLLSLDGVQLQHADLFDVTNSWLTDPVLDRANRRIYVWQPAEHVLRRLDLDSGKIEVLTVDRDATITGPGSQPSGGASGGDPMPDWGSLTSDFRLYYSPQLVAEPGGRRLFALGILATEANNYIQGSSGIWVFDTEKFSVLNRWGAAAAYWSIGVSTDGRWLYAAGSPGVDEDGNSSAWEASITVHDVSDGRPALQLGRLGTETQVLQVPP
jgi:hypothetical protein